MELDYYLAAVRKKYWLRTLTYLLFVNTQRVLSKLSFNKRELSSYSVEYCFESKNDFSKHPE